MARTRIVATLATPTPLLVANVVELWRGVWHHLRDPYRPERYYMRGPGPAWRAKHAAPVRPANQRDAEADSEFPATHEALARS